MFRRSSSNAFKPYALRSGKPQRRVPGWLIWLLIGIILGIGGIIFVQQNYMPPRLSAQESARITQHMAQVQLVLRNTQQQLEEATQDIQRREAERQEMATELEEARAALAPLQQDLLLLLEALPPDPRGGNLQIRAGRFYNENDALDYHVVLTADGNNRFNGSVQFAVEGRYPSGRVGTVELDPLPLQMNRFDNVHGQVPLPDGMRARQITIRVLDSSGRQQAMRVINTRN